MTIADISPLWHYMIIKIWIVGEVQLELRLGHLSTLVGHNRLIVRLIWVRFKRLALTKYWAYIHTFGVGKHLHLIRLPRRSPADYVPFGQLELVGLFSICMYAQWHKVLMVLSCYGLLSRPLSKWVRVAGNARLARVCWTDNGEIIAGSPMHFAIKHFSLIV